MNLLASLRCLGKWLVILLIGVAALGPSGGQIVAQDAPTLRVKGELGPVEVTDTTTRSDTSRRLLGISIPKLQLRKRSRASRRGYA